MKFFDRDYSWLSYNRRVLQEAEYEKNCPAERLKFISIAAANLQVFIRERYFLQLNSTVNQDAEKIDKLKKNISKQFSKCGEILTEIFHSLQQSNVCISKMDELDEIQLKYLSEWFRLKMKPFIHPKFITEENELLTFVKDRLYLFVQLIFHEEKGQVIIEIPINGKDRFVEIPSTETKKIFVMAEEVLRFYLDEIFPGHEIPKNYFFEMISGNEFYAPDEEPGISKDWNKSNRTINNYFLFEAGVSKEIIDTLLQKTNGNKLAIAKKNSYLSLSDFSSLRKLLPDELKEPAKSLCAHPLDQAVSIIDAVNEKDHLLYFPYHSFDMVIRLLKEAASKESVKRIFITLYRTAHPSLIAEQLIAAAANGKTVFAFLEVKASESEADNILLAQKLESSGVKVDRNFPELKIHAKTILIEEEIDGSIKRTALFNTGNLNEKTADKYTDIAILTSKKIITQDVADFFSTLQLTTAKKFHPETVGFSPGNFRTVFANEVSKCIEAVNKNLPAKIIIKVNNLEDEKIIPQLYEAAEAGVQVEIIVRTICCMKPKENIRIISIVDSLLEHARIFSFRYSETENIYITSSDLMTRNLDRRMEFLLPIQDANHRKQLSEILQLQLRDNVKARIIDKKQKNKFVEGAEGEALIRSQYAVHEYFSPLKN